MIRNTVRNSLVLSCLVTLSLLHLLVPSQAEQAVAIDAKILDSFAARNIGPATMTGRITDIAAVESNPKIVYVSGASGGLLKTTDGGETWTVLFDQESSVSIGDVAVSKSNPDIVWVGTGENNVRNSVAWGDGVYKSVDGGKTWKNMGLKDSHTIGGIAIHPTNPDIVYVGALGHIWGPNKERGVFKTTDGGKTWEVSKFIDEDTGFVDLKMDPSDPNVLYGAAYRMRRDAFSGSDNPSTFFLGEKAGIYKTSDGGKTWEHLKVATPTSQYGRCGIDICLTKPNVVYVVVQTEKTPVGEVNQGGANAPGGKPEMGGVYRSDDGGKTWQHQNTLCPRPFYYGQIRVDPNDENRVFVLGVGTVISTDGGKTFGGGGGKGGGGGGGGKKGGFGDPAKKDDPTKKKDDTKKDEQKKDEIKKDELKKDEQKKDDNKKDEQKKDEIKKDELKKDEQKKDETKKDEQKKDEPKKDDPQGKGKGGGGGQVSGVHSDHHALWINPKNSNEVWIGTDGGFGISNDKGLTMRVPRPVNLAQFYGISVDSSKPYYVYGGLQDNGSVGGPSATYDAHGIPLNTWGSIGIGGDGFHTLSDPNDPNILFGGSQYGNFAKGTPRAPGTKGAGGGGKKGGGKADDPAKGDPKKDEKKKDEVKKDEVKKNDPKKDEQKKDDPKKDDPKKDEPQKGGKGGGGKGGDRKSLGVRFNWSSPMAMSPHDSKIIYYGGAHLLQSERGANWKRISPDLTYAPADGKVKNWRHTLFSVNESPKKKGVIWTGADDGRVMVTQDGGENWSECKLPGVPKEGCISRVVPSHHADGTCYVSMTRYRNDDRKPYIFKTTDFGKTWTNISSNLPENGSVHALVESSKNSNLVFCGTEFGLFVTLNGGASWNKMKAGMPTVAVHDIIIHPRERDLVIGTHGRSVYIIDDISPLEQLSPQVASKPAHMFSIRPAVAFKPRTTAAKPKSNEFVGQNPPYGAIIQYNLRNAVSDAAITIHDPNAGNKQIASVAVDGAAGLHREVWNLQATGQEGTVPPGEYLVVFRAGGASQGQKLIVEAESTPK